MNLLVVVLAVVFAEVALIDVGREVAVVLEVVVVVVGRVVVVVFEGNLLVDFVDEEESIGSIARFDKTADPTVDVEPELELDTDEVLVAASPSRSVLDAPKASVLCGTERCQSDAQL